MNQPAVVSNQSDTEPTLTVVVPHGFLPVELEIRSSNGFKHHRIRRGGGAFELPPGDGTINVVCRSHQNNQFAQPFSLRLADGSVSESSVFQDNNGYYHTLEIDLPAVDSIVLDLHRPVVPWNAELIEIEGDFALATLERPWADFDVKHPRFQSLGRWSDSEPYPNTTLCWARFGSVGMAEELASHLVKLRERNKLDDGGLRGAFHTSISVDSTAPLWQEITATELADHLVKAFESLREHRAPLRDGRAVYHPANLNEERTIEQEISRAREILAEQLTATKGG